MGEISSRQIYDLLLEISHDMTQLEASIGELLIDMRTLNRDMLCPPDISPGLLRTLPEFFADEIRHSGFSRH
jgi:hypothetical protein